MTDQEAIVACQSGNTDMYKILVEVDQDGSNQIPESMLFELDNVGRKNWVSDIYYTCMVLVMSGSTKVL